jgi:hypothetical protein
MRRSGKFLVCFIAPVVFLLSLVLSRELCLAGALPGDEKLQAGHEGHEHAKGGETKADDPLRFGPVKLGLDSLVRPEAATDFSLGSFSFTPGNDESRLLFRIRPSVTVSPSENLSARVEGQWYAFYDDTDFSIISLYQGYVEGVLPGVKGVSLKAGRQELVYGSTFLLGADTFFDGLSFDAAKVSWKPSEKLSLDLFGGQYVKKWAGDIEGKLYGIYATYAPEETLSVDLYGFRDTGGAGATHVGGEHERTYSVGARVAGKAAKLAAYELEPVYQFGRKNRDGASHDDIRAYGGHADVTLDPALGRYPGTIFLSYAYGSGDGNPDEGKFKEFHNPNNDTPLIGDMSVIGDLSGLSVVDPAGNDVHASGLHVVTAGVGSDVTEKLNVSLDGHYFRANKVPAGFSKEIGVETNLIFTYKIKESISVLLSGNRFFTGDFFKEAAGSGKDINYVYAQLQATY